MEHWCCMFPTICLLSMVVKSKLHIQMFNLYIHPEEWSKSITKEDCNQTGDVWDSPSKEKYHNHVLKWNSDKDMKRRCHVWIDSGHSWRRKVNEQIGVEQIWAKSACVSGIWKGEIVHDQNENASLAKLIAWVQMISKGISSWKSWNQSSVHSPVHQTSEFTDFVSSDCWTTFMANDQRSSVIKFGSMSHSQANCSAFSQPNGADVDGLTVRAVKYR
jgi:hypothetical protein